MLLSGTGGWANEGLEDRVDREKNWEKIYMYLTAVHRARETFFSILEPPWNVASRDAVQGGILF